jgi:hypothetical protein
MLNNPANDLMGGGVGLAGRAFKGATAAVKALQGAVKDTSIAKAKPLQMHHFATVYGENAKRFQGLIDKYGLKLDGEWNKEILPHIGRHTQWYHDQILKRTEQAAYEAGNDVNKFLELYEKYVKKWVRENPEVMYQSP